MPDQDQPQTKRRQPTAKTSDRRPGLAAIQGEAGSDPRPADRQPGNPAHLGSDRPYVGTDSPFVEGNVDARDR